MSLVNIRDLTFAKVDGDLKWAPKRGRKKRESASARQAAKKRGSGRAAITHWTLSCALVRGNQCLEQRMYFQCLPRRNFLVTSQPTLPTEVQNTDLSPAILVFLFDTQELYSLASQKGLLTVYWKPSFIAHVHEIWTFGS